MPLYVYYPCEGSPGTSFTSNVNPTTPLSGSNITFPDLFPGECYHIGQSNAIPQPTPDVTINWNTEAYTLYPTCQTCVEAQSVIPPCICSTATNLNSETPLEYRYVDCNGDTIVYPVLELGETGPKVCVRNWLGSAPEGTFQYYGDCINDECPPFYLLTDCTDPENTFCTNTNLSAYADNGTSITVNNKCWTVETTNECLNPIVVTVQSSYANCVECLAQFPINYKLTNCEDGSVIYTSTNLSESGPVVQIENYTDECWFVETLTSDIPSDTPVVVLESYTDCPACLATYYILEDCDTGSTVEPIITTTNLEAYVGQVITLSTCPEICWTVSTTDYSPNSQNVVIQDSFATCILCVQAQPATCVTFTNSNGVSSSVDYVNLSGNTEKINVQAQTTTAKICALSWSLTTGVTVNIFGNCIEGVCPEVPQPKRQVTPGYNTPACSTDYYENVECTFSELMYKQVLSERYGISNCCPEEDMKWIIKHEMLMLDILVNPDYDCPVTSDCGCPTTCCTTLNTTCPAVTSYVIEKCDDSNVTEVVRIDNQYVVLGNQIIIDDICYTVTTPTNRLVTVYWVPSTIYETCEDCTSSIA